MKFTELKKSLALKGAKNAYLVFGDDAFLIRSACEMIRAGIEIPELNLALFGPGASVSDIEAALMQLPAMSPKRVVEVEGISKDLKRLRSFLSDSTPGVTLVLKFFGTPPKEAAAIMSGIELVDCSKLSEDTLLKWIASYFSKTGGSVTEPAAKLLIRMCGQDLSRISTECEKLLSAAGENPVGAELVSSMVEPEAEYKIYELSDAIASKQSERALAIYRALFFQMSASAVLGALYSHFRRLLYVSVTSDKESIARFLSVKDYAVTVALRQAKLYTPVKLKAITDRLNELDLRIKTGLIDERAAADTFICGLLA